MSVENAKEFIFMWEIPNFSFDFYKYGEAIDSPIFEVHNFGGSKWFLRLYPSGEDQKSDSFISIYLYKKNNDIYSEDSSLIYELELIGDKNERLGKSKTESTVYKLNSRFGWKCFIVKSVVSKGLKKWPGNVLTVRCHMFNTSKLRRTPHFQVRTEIPVIRSLFLWTVKISDISSQLVSKDLLFTEKSSYEIALSKVDDDAVKICVSQKEESTLPMLIACKLSLVNSRGSELKLINSSHLFETNDKTDVWELPSFITNTDLVDLDSKSDTFSLFCEITGSNGKKSTPIISSGSGTAKFEGNRSILQDLKIMLRNHVHSDLKLKVENEVLHAHKSILASRSPVFSAMFQQDMIESKTGVVDIPDLEANVLKLFLEFLYTDTIENFDYEKTKKLFVIADKYQVSSLTEKCATFFESILSLENVTEILFVADMIKHERLKKLVMNFVAINSVIIFNTPEWQDLIRENVKLAGEMISIIASNFKIVPNN